MTDASSLQSQAFQTWANDRTVDTQVAVTSGGQTHTCSNRTVEVIVSNVGPDDAFLSMTGTGTLNGILLPVGQPVSLLVEPSSVLGLICDAAQTASVNVSEKQAA